MVSFVGNHTYVVGFLRIKKKVHSRRIKDNFFSDLRIFVKILQSFFKNLGQVSSYYLVTE